MKLTYEVFATVCGGTRTDIITCKSKKQAIAICGKLKNDPAYEMVYVQANNGTELVDD